MLLMTVNIIFAAPFSRCYKDNQHLITHIVRQTARFAHSSKFSYFLTMYELEYQQHTEYLLTL